MKVSCVLRKVTPCQSGPGDAPEEAKRAARGSIFWFKRERLSAARQALEGAALAPGNLSTLHTLTDPERRLPLPRQPLSDEVIRTQPVEQFVLDSDQFLLCLRKGRRGAAPGPTGMISDHLFLCSAVKALFAQVGSLLANGNVPDTIIQALRFGRLTALREPDGGVRGIVVGGHHQKVCRQNYRHTGLQESRGSHSSLAVRVVNESRL